MMGDAGGMWFGGGFMWIIWILLIVVVVYAVKASMGGGQTHDRIDESPLEILKKRYARGEIDEQEYERRRDELEGK